MDIGEDSSSRIGVLPALALRNPSSSSSTFFSANQSPQPPSSSKFASCLFPDPCHAAGVNLDSPDTDLLCVESVALASMRLASLDAEACTWDDHRDGKNAPSSTGMIYDSALSSHCLQVDNVSDIFHKNKSRVKRTRRSVSISAPPASLSVNRLANCDIFVGFHGRKPLLLRFTNWLRAELEIQGLSCFVTDRARCRSPRKHSIVKKAMDGSTFGVVILTRKSFRNPYTIEELRFFSNKKNLVPIYYDLGPDDCLVRDIIEKRGEIWERHGGELWLLYGGVEEEWRDAVSALSRSDDWKLDARDGKWRDCILRAVTLLALRLGRRSVVERLTKWREKAERDEFPFLQNENFVGRKRELSELEFMLFGDVCGGSERDYFEIKTRLRKKNLTIGWGRTNSKNERTREWRGHSGKRKGKEPIVWKESENEIKIENTELSQQMKLMPKSKSNGKHGRRRRSTNIIIGKGIACVSGDAGIGKTELLLEFAYRFHQRYKMVLWIGGESRYIQQNFLNQLSFLEIDVGVDSCAKKVQPMSFEEQEEAAVTRVRKELMRNIPFLVIIDNLESEKDWWDHKVVMDLLPRFGGESHVIISTRLSRIMNIEPLRLSYLSGAEAMTLMQGSMSDQSNTEIDALQTIEMKLGRLTLGLAIVGAILSELPINPSRLLDTVNRMPLRDITWMGREDHILRRNNFLLQLFEVCFSIFDHKDGPKTLATRMVLACGWFAPAPIPVTVLALAAQKIPLKHQRHRLWKKIMHSLTCGFTMSYARRSEAEACSLLLRFNIARSCTNDGFIQFNELVKLYARKRGTTRVAQSMVQAVICRGSIFQHSDHIWAGCFLVFGFRKDPIVVELKATELLFLIKEVVLPLAIRTFITFSRCRAALELLRLSTAALEAADQAFVMPVEKWLDKSMCWKPIQTNAQLNPCLWQELALARATVLEVRTKLMMRGGEYSAGDDLIQKAIFIRTSICGEDHPSTASARETLGKLTRLMANVERNTSP